MTTILLHNTQTEATPLVDPNQGILECVKTTLNKYGGSSSYLFLYNLGTKRMLRNSEIPDKPTELDECLDHTFDGASAIVKKSIIDEVKIRFGLTQECTTLKEAFEAARRIKPTTDTH